MFSKNSLKKISKKTFRKVKSRQRNSFTREELAVLLSLPDTTEKLGWRDLVLLSVMYSSGARAQEICNLTVKDVVHDGNADADAFMAEIEAQVRQLVKTYSCISADKQNLFQSERVIIGKCPRCSENVYEGKKNFYCGNRSCQFVMWKNDRFFEQRKKAFTPKIAAALLKNGRQRSRASIPKRQAKPMMQRCFWQIREASTSITG